MKNDDKQLRYLSLSIRLQEAGNPRLVKTTLTVVSLSILVFIGWAARANIHEIAHTPGEVVPSGFQQVVQHLEGGIVRDILAREGAAVEKGQILIRLDGAGMQEDLDRARARKSALSMQEERLRAFIEGRALNLPPGQADQESFFRNMAEARRRESEIIDDQIRQKQRSISVLSAELKSVQENRIITADLLSRQRQLNAEGLLPDMKLMETRQRDNEMEGRAASLKSQIAMAGESVQEYKTRLASLNASQRDAASEKLSTVLAETAQNDEVIVKLEKRVARLDIPAPARGIIKGLAVNTVGSVVQPGQTLMNIVPTDAALVVSLKIPPRYIGRLKTGQDVQVKFSSFDFSRYGSVGGRLELISAATFEGENGERFYQGRVALEKSYVGRDTRNIVVPGMTVMADIITGEKTILEYLLKPIRNALNTAFTEQ